MICKLTLNTFVFRLLENLNEQLQSNKHQVKDVTDLKQGQLILDQ